MLGCRDNDIPSVVRCMESTLCGAGGGLSMRAKLWCRDRSEELDELVLCFLRAEEAADALAA